MKILFVITKYYPKIGGTPNCLRNIVRILKDKHEVHILTTKDRITNDKESFLDKAQIHRVTYYDMLAYKKLVEDVRNNKQFIPNLMFKYFYHMFSIEKIVLISKYRREILNLNDRYSFDCVVAVSGDIYPAIAVLSLTNKLRMTMFYQLDPYSSNETLEKKFFVRRKNIENQIHRRFDSILTTKAIIEEMRSHITLSERTYACEFPNIMDRTEKSLMEEKKNIRGIFCGAIYNARNIDFCLEILEQLYKKSLYIDFDFYLVGNTESIKEKYKEVKNIHVLPPVSQDEIYEKLKEHDFMINIGNVVTNQVPSKIFDYISTGKPILNFVYHDECPTVDIINKYGLGLNIFKNSDIEMNCKYIITFLKNNIGKQISYEEIEVKFYKNTIKSTCEIMTSEIQKGRNKSEK